MIQRHFGFVAAGLLIACSGGSGLPSILLEEQGGVRDATTPAAVTLADVLELRREGDTARASWRLPWPQPWEEYLPWVTPRLGARGYVLVKADGRSRAFSKRLPGDLLLVTLDTGAKGSVVVAFIAMPD